MNFTGRSQFFSFFSHSEVRNSQSTIERWYTDGVLTTDEALLWSRGELERSGVEEPEREGLLLLAAQLRVDRAYLMTHPDTAIPNEAFQCFRRWVRRRAKREPLAYITHNRWFYGLKFYVGKGVLIPRPETETLVELFLVWQQTQQWQERPVLVDVGTGSGCIAIACLTHAPHWQGIGLDASPRALRIARINRKRHSLTSRLQLSQSEWLQEVPDRSVHAVLSNPPYVTREEWKQLPPEIRDWEPENALVADEEDGLSAYRALAVQAKRVLKPGGLLALEIGAAQAEAVAMILKDAGWKGIEIVPDLQGLPRVIKCVL